MVQNAAISAVWRRLLWRCETWLLGKRRRRALGLLVGRIWQNDGWGRCFLKQPPNRQILAAHRWGVGYLRSCFAPRSRHFHLAGWQACPANSYIHCCTMLHSRICCTNAVWPLCKTIESLKMSLSLSRFTVTCGMAPVQTSETHRNAPPTSCFNWLGQEVRWGMEEWKAARTGQAGFLVVGIWLEDLENTKITKWNTSTCSM